MISRTLGELLDRLGGVSPDRIPLHPPPGTATVDDVIARDVSGNVPCELVEGTLVEKAVGYHESLLATFLIRRLGAWVDRRNLGFVTGEAGMMQIFPGLVRIPDVAFTAWARFPEGRLPEEPVPMLVPDLAVEVLSRHETAAEIRRKLKEYFRAGTRLVWLVDPRKRTVAAHTSPKAATILAESETLTGGEVLPGFKLPLKQLFAELDRRADKSLDSGKKSNRKKS
jgi:Uma2 family endonuclease